MKKNKDLPFYSTDKFAWQSYYFILESYKAVLYQKNNLLKNQTSQVLQTKKKKNQTQKVLVTAMDKLHRE